ncbi:Hypothetical protein POVN_LOCUS365 [uncultured virus]|nr:Hypothetical protein POVN_LOCUS365 [uncultured virus]
MEAVSILLGLTKQIETLQSTDQATRLLQWIQADGLQSLKPGLVSYLERKQTELPTSAVVKAEPSVGSHFSNLITQGMETKECHQERPCVEDTVTTHDQALGNYIWLQPTYGKLLWVDFEEPIGSGKWRTYDRFWWARHACVVSHEPDKLYEEHVRFFVDPKTKKINLLFWFERHDGSVYSMAPTEHFYRLEQDYFKANKLCEHAARTQHKEQEGPESLYPQFLGAKH